MTIQKFGVAPAMNFVKSAPNQFLPGRGQGVKVKVQNQKVQGWWDLSKFRKE
jgi:hypothetical protein